MAVRTHIAKVAVGVLLAAIAAAPAFARLPAEQQYRSSWLHSHALNAMYGLGHPVTMTHAEYRAGLIRSAALNERYGRATIGPDEMARLFGTALHRSGAVAPSTTSMPPTAHRPGIQP